jgi:hypothetical protein
MYIAPKFRRNKIKLFKNILNRNTQLAKEPILLMIDFIETGAGRMEDIINMNLYQTPDMNFELHDQTGCIMITTDT